MAKLEAELAEEAAELEELWAAAGAMADETGRLGGTDDEILSQVDALEQRRRQLVATCEGRFAEDAHEQLDASLAGHRAAFDAHASRPDWRFADRLVQCLRPRPRPGVCQGAPRRRRLAYRLRARAPATATAPSGIRLARELGRRRRELDAPRPRASRSRRRESRAGEGQPAARPARRAALAQPVTP